MSDARKQSGTWTPPHPAARAGAALAPVPGASARWSASRSATAGCRHWQGPRCAHPDAVTAASSIDRRPAPRAGDRTCPSGREPESAAPAPIADSALLSARAHHPVITRCNARGPEAPTGTRPDAGQPIELNRRDNRRAPHVGLIRCRLGTFQVAPRATLGRASGRRPATRAWVAGRLPVRCWPPSWRCSARISRACSHHASGIRRYGCRGIHVLQREPHRYLNGGVNVHVLGRASPSCQAGRADKIIQTDPLPSFARFSVALRR